MSFHYIIEAQCDLCGRHQQMARGNSVSRIRARHEAARSGWDYDLKTDTHTCPVCKPRPFKLEEADEPT